MPGLGFAGLSAAFATCVLSLLLLGIAHLMHGRKQEKRAAQLAFAGRAAAIVTALALTICCALLVWCFFAGDVSLDYVVRNRSDATGDMAWLFKLAGLWAGRAGSLLFWAWLIAVFGGVVVVATRKKVRPLDNGALAVVQLVLLAFLAVLLFSGSNMPFAAIDPQYLNDDGSLNATASMLGMNTLLEHWAMAIHPPTLFIGYAGLTVPFAYAVAALVVNDDSDVWVRRATPYLMFSWLLLGAGIGLGAVWAYVVLGWGGYWGWDPVENASLLPWLIGVALIHSFTIYRKRGQFKRWSVMCACLAFASVVLGTFITRSGIVQSVHAFAGDEVSLVLFLVLIIASVATGAVGLLVRRKTFGAAAEAEAEEGSFASRDMAYYVNNLIMVAAAILIAYMTVSSALPTWLPFGGQSLSAGSYNAVARPLGIAYCALIAVCPLLGWARTSGKAFARRALVPGMCGLVAFGLLMMYFCTYLLPSYEAIVAAGGTATEELLEQGPSAYYNGLAVVGFLVASVLFFNAVFMLVRSMKGAKGADVKDAEQASSFRARLSRIGGAICHAGMGVVLVGLIGSSMYVTEVTTQLTYDADADAVEQPLIIQDFQLDYTGNETIASENNDDVDIVLHFDVTRDGQPVGSVSPGMRIVMSTQQQKLEASVLGFPLEDLFVVFRGTTNEGALAMDVRVNPLIGFVWAGFALLLAGALLALFARRPGNEDGDSGQKDNEDRASVPQDADGEGEAQPTTEESVA